MTFNNETRRGIRGVMMGCFMVNLFLFLMTMEALGGGQVDPYLPLLPLGSSILCLVGFWSNKPLPEEDDE
jgi:hypothetical protein